MKDYKIKRYGRDRRRQKTAATARVVLMVALIAAACCAGMKSSCHAMSTAAC